MKSEATLNEGGAKGGAIAGTISGIGAAAQYANKNNVNIITGKPNPVPESPLKPLPTPRVGVTVSEASLPVGRGGSPMNCEGLNSATTIDGLEYSGHALDQMQGRGFTPSVVKDAYDFPMEVTAGNKPNTVVYHSNQIRVITNFEHRIITVIHRNR